MTFRASGKRIGKRSIHRKNTTKRAKRKKDVPLSPKERRCFLQLIACSGIFVLIVSVKLLLPGRLTPIQERVTSVLRQNMDVQAVFSAVAQAVNGEQGTKQAMSDVYQAVFHPQEEAEILETAVIVHGEVPMIEDMALNSLRKFRQETVAEPQQIDATTENISTMTYVLYSDENLPENVSMEQAILGFSYCAPVSGTITSPFGYREHPTEGTERFHYGIDLAADNGAEINCFADGRVKAVGESSSYGKYVIVSHLGGYDTLYAHCSQITVSSGTNVVCGEAIAKVGETGMATGPHLHFELLRNNVYLNPVYYVKSI